MTDSHKFAVIICILFSAELLILALEYDKFASGLQANKESKIWEIASINSQNGTKAGDGIIINNTVLPRNLTTDGNGTAGPDNQEGNISSLVLESDFGVPGQGVYITK